MAAQRFSFLRKTMNDLLKDLYIEDLNPESLTPEDIDKILNTKFDFIETLDEYVKANEELERLQCLDLDPDSVEFDDRCYLSDRVMVYEMQNFQVLYPGSPYLKQFEGNAGKLEVLRTISEDRLT